MQESVFVDDFSRSFRVLVVTFHGIVAAVAHFSLHTDGAFFTCFRVDDLYFRKLKVTSDGCVAHFGRVVNTGMCHTGRGFRQSIYTGDLHKHLFFNLLHEFYRAERSGHDAGAQAGEIEHVEHGMVEFGNKHGGTPYKAVHRSLWMDARTSSGSNRSTITSVHP